MTSGEPEWARMHFINGIVADPIGTWHSLSMPIKLLIVAGVVLSIYTTIKGLIIRR